MQTPKIDSISANNSFSSKDLFFLKGRKINLLYPERKKKRKRLLIRVGKVILGLFILIVIVFSCFFWRIITTGQEVFIQENEKNEKISFFGFVKRLILSENKEKPIVTKERLNILLLGIGGEGHEGALLTDTIVVVSIKPKSGNVAMISIPRDLYLSLDGKIYQKINSINAYGEIQKPGMGANLTSKAVEQVTGLPIDYYIRVDFEAFKKVVDLLGGIDIYVERSFYDPNYPGPNYGYQTVSFKKGWNHMNGDEALKYVRSRHGIVLDGEGNEASDFARAKRQQKVISAIKNKAFSLNIILNPKKLSNILAVLGGHVRTNIRPEEIFSLIEVIRNVNTQNMVSQVIDIEHNLVYASKSKNGAYILLPKGGNFNQIHKFCQDIFLRQEIQEEYAKIEIQNGTGIKSLAKNTAEELKKSGYNIVKINNAQDRDFERTVIYNFASSNKSATIKALREKFNANVCTFAKKFTEEDIDLVLVLGKDRGKLTKAD